MDRLAALKAELEKKRKANSQLYNSGNKQSTKSGAKRWRSAADIEREREQKYRKEEAQKKLNEKKPQQEKEVEASSSVKQNKDNKKSTSERNENKKTDVKIEKKQSNKNTDHEQTVKEKEPPLSKKEVIRRLRGLKQPATLFGESDWNRFERLRNLQLTAEETSEGQRNVFQKKLREMEQKDAKDDELRFSGAQMPQLKPRQNEEKDAHEEIDEINASNVSKEDYVHSQIRKYLRLWRSEINEMSKEERRTKKGRTQAVTYEQTKEWLQPLERLLRKQKVNKNVLSGLVQIFEAVAEKEYVDANRLYLERLAIGNAPWPMGATMVGIHARAAREKIGEDKIAHVMNDEQTRKYIQAVKRLIGVAQRHFPTILSKMVL